MEEQAKYETKAGAATTGTGCENHRDFNQILTKMETLAGLIGATEPEGLEGSEIAGIGFILDDLAAEIRSERNRSIVIRV